MGRSFAFCVSPEGASAWPILLTMAAALAAGCGTSDRSGGEPADAASSGGAREHQSAGGSGNGGGRVGDKFGEGGSGGTPDGAGGNNPGSGGFAGSSEAGNTGASMGPSLDAATPSEVANCKALPASAAGWHEFTPSQARGLEALSVVVDPYDQSVYAAADSGSTPGYDPVHHVIYSANWGAGFWRYVTAIADAGT